MVCAPTGKHKIVANIPMLIPNFVMELSFCQCAGRCFRAAGSRFASQSEPSARFFDVGRNQHHAHHT
jgi:hypothetical protein